MEPNEGPERGYCKLDGCREPALPMWLVGKHPDEPDLFYCHEHTGLLIKVLLGACEVAETWFSGSVLSSREQYIVHKLRGAIGAANHARG
jgi:hypothetical protein